MSVAPTSATLAAAISIAAIVLAGSAALADVVHLKNGQRLEGEVIEAGGEVSIRSAVGTIGLPADLVLRIERGSSLEEQALERLRAMSPGEVDGRVELALELEDAGARTLAQRVFLEALQRDPDHPAARRALGYVRCDDQWLTDEECHRRRGEVLHDGEWISADQRSVLLALEHERRRSDLERLRGEILVESALLRADREAAASAYGGGGGGYGADPFGYPYDPYYDGGGIPYWPYPVYGVGVVPVPGHRDGRVSQPGRLDQRRPTGGVHGGGDRARGPRHHQGGAPPRPLVPQHKSASRQAP